MGKVQNPKQNRFVHLELEIGIYLGFGICHLGFVAVTSVRFSNAKRSKLNTKINLLLPAP